MAHKTVISGTLPQSVNRPNDQLKKKYPKGKMAEKAGAKNQK
jgi:hypothetical protein